MKLISSQTSAANTIRNRSVGMRQPRSLDLNATTDRVTLSAGNDAFQADLSRWNQVRLDFSGIDIHSMDPDTRRRLEGGGCWNHRHRLPRRPSLPRMFPLPFNPGKY